MDNVERRLDRLEQSVAELTHWVRGDWHSSTAAGQILGERRVAERDASEREARVRAEVDAGTEGLVRARLAGEEVGV
jgi:hypothetical protein